MVPRKPAIIGNPARSAFQAKLPASGPKVMDFAWNTGVALPMSCMPAMKIMSFRARTSSFPRSPTITAFVPCGTHVSHIFDAIAAESTICTYSGNHSESSIRFVLPHNAFAPSDKATRSSRTEEFMPDSAPISATFPISEATSPLHHMFFAVCRRVIATPINHNNAPETDYKSP